MYTAPTASSAGAQVARSSQSNGGVPEREPTRTGRPRSVSRSTTRRPVLPVPPSTSVLSVSFALPIVALLWLRFLGYVRGSGDSADSGERRGRPGERHGATSAPVASEEHQRRQQQALDSYA